MVLTKRRFNPKNTTNYNADRVERAQSVFQAESDSQVSTDLSVSIQLWMRKRGREVQHPITELQRRQLHECFELIDTDGSGSLNAKELYDVFEVMGIGVSMDQIEDYVKEMDTDGSGELEFNEFLQIMHKQLFERDPNASVWKDDIYTEESRARAKGAAGKPPVKKSPMVPLHLLAGAYRRKKVLDAVMENTHDMRKRLIASGQEFKQMNAQKQHDVETNTKQAGQAWRTKANANKVASDRLSSNANTRVDILNPSASTTPNVTPRVPEEADQGDSGAKEKSKLDRSPSKPAARPEPDGAAPSAKKTARSLWGDAKSSDKLGQMVGTALVVKRDLHKRSELREKMESFQRRPPVFDSRDRHLLPSDKVALGIMNDEMRGLARVGLVPRASQNAACSEAGPFSRPATVPTHFGGTVGRSRGGGGPAFRPSTVPVGIQRTGDADYLARQISDALSYKAIPPLVEEPDDYLQPPSPPPQTKPGRPSTTPGGARASRAEEAGRSNSASGKANRRRMTPEAAGRDLLVQRRLDRDAQMKGQALHREFGGRQTHAWQPHTRVPPSPGQTPGVRQPGRESEGRAFARPRRSHRSAQPLQPSVDEELVRESRPVDEPQTAWVSPYTGRKGTPMTRNSGLALDSAISSRSHAIPQPGVPIWKVSEQEMLKSRRPVTVQKMRSVQHPSSSEGSRGAARAGRSR
mmetsp:Transcript_16766/g.43479  ORF Transcript_16766/g.43479 Transcript_16766/m.43479 type:complete len:693 (+) Transcript_16766:72-2150(+)